MKSIKEKHGLHSLVAGYEIFCGYLLLLAIFISLAEIVARVVFKTSFDLFFSLTVWISIWSLLLITGLLIPTEEHLSIDAIRNRLNGKPRWLLEVALGLVTIGYGALITWGGILFTGQLYQRKSVFATYIAIPKWVVELCVPIGMGLFTLLAVLKLIRTLRIKW